MKALKVQSQETQKRSKKELRATSMWFHQNEDRKYPKIIGPLQRVCHVDSSCPDRSGRCEQLREDLRVRKHFLLNSKLGHRLYSELGGNEITRPTFRATKRKRIC